MDSNGNINKVSYTAVVLDEKSVAKLISSIIIPTGWIIYCHHMTINMGAAANGPAVHLLAHTVRLQVHSVGQDDKVIAVGVTTDAPSQNATKHITVAVNRAGGGKPFMSNKLTEWKPITPFALEGFVAECAQGDIVIN